ncbi:RNA polymerase sigma-70 factor, ECF subfamily [bacterium A37T11]|nr:RNA polymerase sigma-70 factor, ECF subfamily [bacterium A37T11]
MADCSKYTEPELLLLLKEGNERAFTEIYKRYWDKLYYLAHRTLRSAAEAEEVVQDVFVKLWNKHTSLDIQVLPVYLAAMTRYAVYHHLAGQKLQQERIAALKLELPTSTSMENSIEHKLMLEIITELSNQLPEKCRLVFQYNKLQDKALIDVAKELNISEKTAESHLTKALKIIRKKFGEGLYSIFL